MLDGLYMTLEVSMLSLLFATLWGSVICILRMSRNRWLRAPAGIYIELMRSLPLLVLLLVSFYVIFAATALTKVQVSVVCFVLYFGAYFAEIFRTGITGVEKGQWEAGAALGMNKRQVFGKIVLPQALLNILPVFRTQTTALIKATSIVGYISVMDITKAGDYIRSRTFDAFFPLLLVAAIYLILSWIFGTGIDAIQHRLTPKSHRL
jgi:polar amino acid transport system substrate-binding protein